MPPCAQFAADACHSPLQCVCSQCMSCLLQFLFRVFVADACLSYPLAAAQFAADAYHAPCSLLPMHIMPLAVCSRWMSCPIAVCSQCMSCLLQFAADGCHAPLQFAADACHAPLQFIADACHAPCNLQPMYVMSPCSLQPMHVMPTCLPSLRVCMNCWVLVCSKRETGCAVKSATTSGN